MPLILLPAIALLAGCTFEDGSPWGVAEVSVELSGDAPDVRLRFASATLVMADSGGSTDFDPADPPPGYSHCHNGHCHTEDGRLVDYETIAAELAGGGASSAPRITLFATGEALPVTPQGVAVPLGRCPGDLGCVLPRGRVTGLELLVTELDVDGTVTPVEIRLFAPLNAAVDRGEAVRLRIDASIRIDEPPTATTLVDVAIIEIQKEGSDP